MMPDLTDADLAAMKARAEEAQKDYAQTERQNRGWMTSTERNAEKLSKDSLKLLVEVAALRKQIDCRDAIAERATHSQHCNGGFLPGTEFQPPCTCWRAEYDAAKEALDHE